MKDLCHNVMTGYYLPISGFSNDMKEIISKMLVVNPQRRASTDELLNCEIIKKRIKSTKNEIITQGIQSSKKANFIKTIKLPRNMHDINLALPQNRYNPKEIMMENDPYEKIKNIYMETIKKQNFNPNNVKIQAEPMNNYDKNALAQKKYQQYQQQNGNNKLDIIEEKPKQQNKYAYLNKYDNNMRLKNDNLNKNKSPIKVNNNNANNRPQSHQINNNFNRYNNNNNKSPLNNKNNGDFSKGNKKNRYQNMFGEDDINQKK